MATNLEFIDSFEVTSPVSSFTLDNVFSDKYDVYFLVYYINGLKMALKRSFHSLPP